MSLIYNLTGHICSHKDVESEPRVQIMCDPRDFVEILQNVKDIAKAVPRNSSVLIGGHSQIVSLLLQVARIKRWRVYFFSTYDEKLYPATFISRMDRLEIEREA